MLCGLTAHEGDPGLLAGSSDTTDDAGDPFGDDRPTGDVVGHEKRLGATHHDVVHDHADQVEANGVVPVHGLSDRDLGADPIGAGRQDRAYHPGHCAGVEESGEATQTAEDFGPGGPPHVRLHQFDGSITSFDVDSGGGIRDGFAHRSSVWLAGSM